VPSVDDKILTDKCMPCDLAAAWPRFIGRTETTVYACWWRDPFCSTSDLVPRCQVSRFQRPPAYWTIGQPHNKYQIE